MQKFDVYLKKNENDEYFTYYTTIKAVNSAEALVIANGIAAEVNGKGEQALEVENEQVFII